MRVNTQNNSVNDTDLDNSRKLPISLAYSPSPTKSIYEEITVTKGTTLLQALHQVGWLQKYPQLKLWCDEHATDEQIDNKTWYVGVFSQKKLLNYVLQSHDRIEVYRPLTIEPMRMRKNRATTQ